MFNERVNCIGCKNKKYFFSHFLVIMILLLSTYIVQSKFVSRPTPPPTHETRLRICFVCLVRVGQCNFTLVCCHNAAVNTPHVTYIKHWTCNNGPNQSSNCQFAHNPAQQTYTRVSTYLNIKFRIDKQVLNNQVRLGQATLTHKYTNFNFYKAQ